MEIKNLGYKSVKLENIDDMYPVQDILIKTGQILQYESGIYGFDHIPYLAQKKIESIIIEELEKIDCTQVSLPILQPASIWKDSGRWDRYVSDGTMFVVDTKKAQYGLAPTAEEAVVKFAEKRLTSYKNLPVTFFQIGEKFRNELRPRGFLLRGKTFNMMDAYSFNSSESDLIETYNKIREAYFNIFKKLGLTVFAVAADNGAIGGKKSEEFMVLSEMGEDTILIDRATGKALNSEILDRPDCMEYLDKEYGIKDVSQLEKKRAVELGHIFQLGTKYSEAMGATFSDKDGSVKPYYMGCYGIGVSRLLAMVYELNVIRDKEKPIGASLPEAVSPYLIYIITKNDNAEKMQEAREFYNMLMSNNIPAIIDDRQESIGSKAKDCKVLGIPYMVIFGNKLEAGKIELEKTLTSEKSIMLTSDLMDIFLDKKNNLEKRR